MKQTLQRTLAFLLAFVMLVGMMPIGAMAAEPEAATRSASDYPAIQLNTDTEAVITSPLEVVYFAFTPTESAEYTFYSTGDQDTYGYIYNSSMNCIADNDDNDDDYNFFITCPLEANVTYILAVKLCSTELDSFNIRITKKHTHAFSEVVTAPTCTENGHKSMVCDLCGYHYVVSEIPARHSLASDVCTVCGVVLPTLKPGVEYEAIIDNGGDIALFLFTPILTAEYEFFSDSTYASLFFISHPGAAV